MHVLYCLLPKILPVTSKNVTSYATQTVYKVAKNSVDKMTKINTLTRVNAKYSWKAVSINT